MSERVECGGPKLHKIEAVRAAAETARATAKYTIQLFAVL